LFVTNLHSERSLFPLQLAFYSAAKTEAPVFGFLAWSPTKLECVNARCVCLSICPSVCPDDYDSTHNSRTTRADTQRNQRTYDNKIERVAADCSRQFLLHKMPNCLARLTANNKQLTTNEEWPNLELPSGKCKPSFIFACETAGFALWPG